MAKAMAKSRRVRAWFSTWLQSENGIAYQYNARQNRTQKNKVMARSDPGLGSRRSSSQGQSGSVPPRALSKRKGLQCSDIDRITFITALMPESGPEQVCLICIRRCRNSFSRFHGNFAGFVFTTSPKCDGESLLLFEKSKKSVYSPLGSISCCA